LNDSTSPFATPILAAGPDTAAESEPLARAIAAVADEAKAVDIRVLRVLELVQYTDWFVVCTGRSDRHVRAIYEALKDAMTRQKVKPLSVEGVEAGQWICCDYGSVVVHIFYEPVREFYGLERLWSDAPRLEL
jgi:ribosome-associated protein